jgi:hypothetical protein
MSPAARAGAQVAPAAAQVALAGVRAVPVDLVAPADLAALAAVRAVLAGPPDRLAHSATRSSSPTPCASSPT